MLRIIPRIRLGNIGGDDDQRLPAIIERRAKLRGHLAGREAAAAVLQRAWGRIQQAQTFFQIIKGFAHRQSRRREHDRGKFCKDGLLQNRRHVQRRAAQPHDIAPAGFFHLQPADIFFVGIQQNRFDFLRHFRQPVALRIEIDRQRSGLTADLIFSEITKLDDFIEMIGAFAHFFEQNRHQTLPHFLKRFVLHHRRREPQLDFGKIFNGAAAIAFGGGPLIQPLHQFLQAELDMPDCRRAHHFNLLAKFVDQRAADLAGRFLNFRHRERQHARDFGLFHAIKLVQRAQNAVITRGRAKVC
ncbi:MAG: hypothetical protein ALAOOOJD_02881 [bacterium]|nr:hypothetical protein [bacterium]